MTSWSDIRHLLEGDDELPDLDEVLALLTAGDRQASGPSWFARALAQSRPAWMADGLCAEYPEVNFFPGQGEPVQPAKETCRRCIVQEDCLRWAIDHDERGIWGATSARERTAMRQADEAA